MSTSSGFELVCAVAASPRVAGASSTAMILPKLVQKADVFLHGHCLGIPRGVAIARLDEIFGAPDGTHEGEEAEIMNRKCRLSLEMIRRLHDGLGAPLESLVQPYDPAA